MNSLQVFFCQCAAGATFGLHRAWSIVAGTLRNAGAFVLPMERHMAKKTKTSKRRDLANRIARVSPASRTTSGFFKNKKTGKSRGAVKKAVKKVGNSRKKVRRALGR